MITFDIHNWLQKYNSWKSILTHTHTHIYTHVYTYIFFIFMLKVDFKSFGLKNDHHNVAVINSVIYKPYFFVYFFPGLPPDSKREKNSSSLALLTFDYYRFLSFSVKKIIKN